MIHINREIFFETVQKVILDVSNWDDVLNC